MFFWARNVETDSGKNGMMESSAERSAELFSKTWEMVPNGLTKYTYVWLEYW